MNDEATREELADMDEAPTVEHFGPRSVTLATLPVGAMSGDDTDDESDELDSDPAPLPTPVHASFPVPQPAPAPAPQLAPPAVNPRELNVRGFVGRPVEGDTSEMNNEGGVVTLAVTVGVAGTPNEVAKLKRLLSDALVRGKSEAASWVSAAVLAVRPESPEVDRLQARVTEQEQKAAELAAKERDAEAAARQLLNDGADPSEQEAAADAAAVALDRAHRRLATLKADLREATAKFAASRSVEVAGVKQRALTAVKKQMQAREAKLQANLAMIVVGRLDELLLARAAVAYCEANGG